MGIQVCENQGAGTYWGPNKGQKVVKFGHLMNWQSKYSDI